MRTIVITGPESTGKTTLARQLSTHYASTWVPEYAVEYLEDLDRPYEFADLVAIGKGHLERINEKRNGKLPYLFCDTDLINIHIWSEFKYDRVDPWIRKQTKAFSADLYLLCDIDIPWEPHPLREHPHLRKELFNLHEQALIDLGKSYTIISGTIEKRLRRAVSVLDARFETRVRSKKYKDL